jgi:hypothetical protein
LPRLKRARRAQSRATDGKTAGNVQTAGRRGAARAVRKLAQHRSHLSGVGKCWADTAARVGQRRAQLLSARLPLGEGVVRALSTATAFARSGYQGEPALTRHTPDADGHPHEQRRCYLELRWPRTPGQIVRLFARPSVQTANPKAHVSSFLQFRSIPPTPQLTKSIREHRLCRKTLFL